ncbi:hypothetical protein QBC37DRAFT_376993 [Rhypophila decipiens]|uniref:Uncharacterized protein n=1 Tax=Rhypophila decipiens TaxID=261697 RepID=A0AAN6Y3B6_9PEZI|nr:hypothetical protein QBC37DRAFT_376993 [Rhypophila decipiens]
MHPFTLIFFGAFASALPLSTGVSPDSETVAHSGVDMNAVDHYARDHKAHYEHYKDGKADDTNQGTAPRMPANSKTHSVQNTYGHHSIEARQGLNPYLVAKKPTQAQYVSDGKENNDSMDGKEKNDSMEGMEKQDSQSGEEKKHSQN